MLVSGETSANQPRKLSGLRPGRQFLFELGIGRSPETPFAARYVLYLRRFLCRCAFMRLRRLCLAIFALRLFLREPIQIFKFASSDSTIRCAAMQISSRCDP